eukprot:ANDGO_00464.mRNA.1 hypothetical protein
MVYTYIPRSMPDGSNAWNHAQFVPENRREMLRPSKYAIHEHLNEADNLRKSSLVGIQSFEKAILGHAMSKNQTSLASSVRSRSAGKLFTRAKSRTPGSPALSLTRSAIRSVFPGQLASGNNPEFQDTQDQMLANPQGEMLQNIKRSRMVQRMESGVDDSGLGLAHEFGEQEHAVERESRPENFENGNNGSHYSPRQLSRQLLLSESQRLKSAPSRVLASVTSPYRKVLVQGSVDFYSRPDLDMVAADRVAMRIAEEEAEEGMKMQYIQEKRYEDMQRLESRKAWRIKMQRKAWGLSAVGSGSGSGSGLCPSDSAADEDQDGPATREEIDEFIGTQEARAEESAFGPEAYRRFSQQVLREGELLRMNERRERREQLEMYCGTMYVRNKFREEQDMLHTQAMKTELAVRAVVPEDADALRELEKMDSSIYSKIKQERKHREAHPAPRKFK